MNQKVSIVRCPDYDLEHVKSALKKNLNLLGGINCFVKPGQRVCLKANLLLPARPELAVTTHPTILEAMANLVREAGGKPFIADSPGGGVPYTEEGLRRVYRKTGLLDLAERTGIELNWDTTITQVSLPEGKMIKRLDIIKPVLDADVVIGIPKLKSHVLTTFTGATKILFGVVPGLTKSDYHAKLPDLERFAEMLLDIIVFVKPALFVMDGVLGIEGDGPSLHGTPRQIGLLLASSDAVALDVVASQVIGIDPERIPMLKMAKARSWWNGSIQSIEIVGCPIKEIVIQDFKLPQGGLRVYKLSNPSFFQRVFLHFFKHVLLPRPEPQRGKCVACGNCVRSCPQKAVSIVDKLAVVDDNKCIRCYCCHEFCPEAAIELKFSWLYRMVSRSGALSSLKKASNQYREKGKREKDKI